jgi:ADP-ribose pyrophosphatase YjhB (NUDIX family)
VNSTATPPIRRAARALIVDAEQRVLLCRVDLADRDAWWYAPGGAIEDGETFEAALVREVMEETGLAVDLAALGPPVWIRDYTFTWNATPEHHVERFFLVQVVTHDADTGSFEMAESEVVRTFRWWRLDDILRSTEPFSPGRLGEHLATLLQGGVPGQPVVVGE